MAKKLYKSRKNKMIDGVCGGFADFFGIDATIIRLLFVLLVVFRGAGVLLYIVACIVIPREKEAEDDVENLKSANISEDDARSGAHTDEEFDAIFRKK